MLSFRSEAKGAAAPGSTPLATLPATSPAHGGQPGGSHKLIMTGLLLGILLAALDQTVVSTSLPRIVGELHGLSRFTWLISGYMLSSTLVIPLAGKLSDRLGRRPVFMFGMGAFLVGSMLCGLAQTMDQLVLFRFVQGIGGGAIFPVAFATVADLYSPAERAKVQGALSGVWGLASIIGPLMGGFIVDHTTWRWVFYVNLPVGLLALAVTARHFPRTVPRQEHPLDWRGAALLGGAISAFMLIVLGGGVDFDWISATTAALAVVVLVAFALFLREERRAPDPVVPLAMFREPVVRWSALSVMLLGSAMFGVIAFLPLFLQVVIGVSATSSAFVLMPMTLLLVLGTVVSGRALPKIGYKKFILAGPALVILGLLLLSRLHTGSAQAEALAYTGIVGLGLGFTMATYMVAVQNVVSPRNVGTATSTVTLSRSLGAALGIAVLGGLFNQLLRGELAARLPPQVLAAFQGASTGFDASNFAKLPAAILGPFREALSASITPLFLGAAVAAFLALLFSTRVPEVRLKGREEYFRAMSALSEGGAEVPAMAPNASTAAAAAVIPTQAAPAPAPLNEAPPSEAPRIAVRLSSPKLLDVRHSPPMPEPGQSVETVARLAPENGSAPRADVEVRVGGTVMARARAFVGPAGAEVRLQWRLPPGTSGPVVTSVAPVP